MRRDSSSWRPSPGDILVAGGTAFALVVLTFIATEEGPTRQPDSFAYALAALVGVVLLWRRKYPVGVAVVSLLLVVNYHVLGYPAIGNLPLAVSLFNASYRSATVPAIVIGSTAVLGTLTWFLVGDPRPMTEALNLFLRESGILAALILTGSVLRSREQLAEETRERLRAVRADQKAQSARRMAEERLVIAREIHDVISHTVTLIGVQAKVALETLHDSPSEAERALKIISDSTRDAASELRATVGVLRSEPSLSPAPRLDQLGGLVESISGGDVTVELVESGDRREVSGLVGLVAYRVVQEALTNVVKHAQATKAVVEVGFNTSHLSVSVSDDGVGGAPKEGHGIAGMRERVEAVGGTLSIGPSDAGGIQVLARLRLEEPR